MEEWVHLETYSINCLRVIKILNANKMYSPIKIYITVIKHWSDFNLQ